MPTRNVKLKQIISGEIAPGRLLCKTRITDHTGFSQTGRRSYAVNFTYKQIPRSDQFTVTWRTEEHQCSIQVGQDDDLDFIEDSVISSREYKIFIR